MIQGDDAGARAAPPVRVRLAGPFGSSTGIGLSARGTAAALAAAQVPFNPVEVVWNEPRDGAIPPPRPCGDPDAPAWPVDLIHMNPGELHHLADQHPGFLAPPGAPRPFTIGFWAWETIEGPPAHWRGRHRHYDEVWAPSRHAAEAIARSVPFPVAVIPHPIEPPAPTLGRAALGLPAGAFVFLFISDGRSNLERKNPAAVIAAYRSAFPTPSPATMLVIKTRALQPHELAGLFEMAVGRGDIRILPETWDEARLVSLIAACDAYVSLHRAEGFGRTMAEAMYFAKPVIATAYSGNLDFMTPETAWLVPFRLKRLEAASGYYASGSTWADPVTDAAAVAMARLAADRAGAAALGERAAAWVRARLGVQAVGRLMRARLTGRAEALADAL